MANRYLRGTGARNWNDTNNWSETSGGAGGASVPTSTDSVIFDANSGTGTITVNAIANMLDFTCSNIGTLTLANSAYAFNVYGSLTLQTNLTTSFTATGYLYLKSTTTGKNITSNGNTRAWNRIYFDGVGGEWINQDDWNYNTQTHLINGTWNTNGKTITTNLLWFETGVKTLMLGASIFNCGNINYLSSGGSLTINAGTSTINTGNIPLYGAITLYNLNITTTTTSAEIAGIVTVNNLSIQASSTVFSALTLRNNFTVSNILTLQGFNDNRLRLLLCSTNIGTPRTITVNGSIVASNVDFRDITLAGTANRDLSAITGGSGDCQGNSGITFTPAINNYFKHTSGACNWADVTKWVTTDGGSTQARVPLPQDTAIFTANSFTGASTVNINCPRAGKDIDFSEINQSVIANLQINIALYGSLILSNLNAFPGNNIISFFGRGSHVIKTFNKEIYSIGIYSIGGNYRLESDLTLSEVLRHYYGTLDFNNYNYTGQGLLSGVDGAGVGGQTINMRSGIITLTRESGYIFIPSEFLTTDTSTLIFSPRAGTSTVTALLKGFSYNKIICAGAHTGVLLFNNNLSVNELVIQKGRKLQITGGRDCIVAKTSIQGTPTEPVVLTSTNTTPFNLIHSGSGYHQWDYVNVSYCNATPNRFYAGERSTNGGNNTGVLFRNYLHRCNRILKRWIKPINFN